MPSLSNLANSVSTLRYIPYGSDRSNGGSSNEPYIRDVVYPSDLTGISSAVVHTATDVVRMTKFLADLPKGPLFIAKQMGLQMMNPRLETLNTTPAPAKPITGQGFINNVSNLISNTASNLKSNLGSNRIWSPANFLAQVAVSATGKGIPRQGLSLSVDDKDKYPYIAVQNDKNGNNRLVGLMKDFAYANYTANQKKPMFSFNGGASSFLGIGTTTINSYYSTFAASDISNPDSLASLNGFIPITQREMLSFDPYGDDLASYSEAIKNNDYLATKGFTSRVDVPQTLSLRNSDFRAYKVATNPAYAKKVLADNIRITDYKKYNTVKRIGVINTNAVSEQLNPNDSINMMSLYYAQDPVGNNTKDINNRDVTPNNIRDLIKFRIKAIDNDKPGFGMYMIFRAFLDGPITDNIEVNHNTVKYTGRGETFYGYEGTTSRYSLSFTVAALSREEMKPLYQKLNYLKSSLFPDYKNNKMRGNFHELTVGDLIKYQPGIITSLTITTPEDAMWEIAMNEPDNTLGNLDKDMHELPMKLKVSMSFIPIYNFLPRKSSHAPFFGIDDSEWNRTVAASGNAALKRTAGPKEWLDPKANTTDFKNR
jgi:hypothetical protein